MQEQMDFRAKREAFVGTLSHLERIVETIFEMYPESMEIKNSNKLIRYIWDNFYDYKAGSILRTARKIRAKGMDTEENQLERANAETAYRQHFNS